MKSKVEKNDDFEKMLLEEVIADFKKRQEERRSFEAQWQLNMNFLMGNQYCDINRNNELQDYDKQYFWQAREVYNHIAAIVDNRLSKLQRVRPKMNVFPASSDENDEKTAQISKKIIDSVYNSGEVAKVIREAIKWSEVCGSGFYKVVWNNNKGDVVGTLDTGMPLRSGDVEITAVSPFEIYPESSTCADIASNRSIIHARAYHVDEIKNQWGVETAGQDINVFTLDKFHSNLGSSTKVIKSMRSNYAIVIERYEAPTVKFPNGRLVIVAGDKLVHVGELPYVNGDGKTRTFPFIKQDSVIQLGCFWGASIIERLIPLQRSYNALKNRKHEFINRLSMGVLTVEDGSIDLNNLEEDGLCPGKVIVYRQGSNKPKFLDSDRVPFDFAAEERHLQEEFEKVSGVSDVNVVSYMTRNISGVALDRIVEEEENKFLVTTDSIKFAIKEIAKQILRLYKQFVKVPRLVKLLGEKGEMQLFYFNSNDITSDEIIFETKNEILDSFTQRRSMLFDLIDKGILTDENGRLSKKTKSNIISELGFDMWENLQDVNELHLQKAQKENYKLMSGEGVEVLEIDNHDVHITQHVSFMLGADFEKLRTPQLEEKMLQHIREHKRAALQVNHEQ